MKNQYFGDMYDYIKYGLLRQLSGCGKVSLAVCWMLTENDDRRLEANASQHQVFSLIRCKRFPPSSEIVQHSTLGELDRT